MLSALFVTADIPAYVTIVVAFLTGAFGVIGGVITASKQSAATLAAAHEQAEATVRSAQEQSGASVLNAESSRFAAWQMHKREIYAAYVGAARAVAEASASQDARAAYLVEADRVMLVASKELRDYLEPLVRDPGRLTDATQWTEMVDKLGEDARRPRPGD